MSSIQNADSGAQNADQTSPLPQVPEAAHVEHGVQTSPTEQAPGAPPPIVIQQPAKKQSFAEEVVGYAKIAYKKQIRGTVLRQPETKEMGEKILKGEASYNPKGPPE
ncbi:uncharacterized protein C8Q71DRAFT_853751 [Rhodofomes roseus]|uniref:Uncharacterized protein n=1 Tax=Rhodofomes roseus TaxID=34475 RepID=A0ABQ8KSS0_9APHY|nr:uncharacterized protein C8Q71DRAFT_853751 [Rhodofomes roseus]KAH9841347.1 hypothetical protein C8Q71DRAFT_853751 [Rhodofomes roseus]